MSIDFEGAPSIGISGMMMKSVFTHCFSSSFLFCFSPPRTPVKAVPQIRIELEPEDNDYPWRNKGTETTL